VTWDKPANEADGNIILDKYVVNGRIQYKLDKRLGPASSRA